MNVEGVWKIEMFGPYGWEAVGTAFLDGGQYREADKDSYVLGTYRVSGDEFELEGKFTTVSGSQPKTLFGMNQREYKFAFKGKIEGETIRGQATNGEYSVASRATRVGDLA